MTEANQKQLGNTLWSIADQLRGAMDADDFRDYMLSFLFLRYLSDNYETAAKKELGRDYPDVGVDTRKVPLALWYANNVDDIAAFEKQMRRKVHYVIQPAHLWNSIANLARTQNADLLNTLQAGFKYIETESFESTFQGLFSEIDLSSPKLGKRYEDRNAKLCTIIQKIAEGLAEFSTDIDALGDAYEYLIGQFAAGSGKKAGEFYTPQQISDILSAIVTLDSQEPKTGTKKRLESVLDFACGSGSLLLNVRKKLNKAGGTIGKIFGQEKNITTYILVLKKCKKPDDVLFINAAEHFVKGKRQNRLRNGENGGPDDIKKIIDTYQFRKEEPRYARRVSMAEIEKNDFNLNISRYISTAVGEEEIDLKAVNAELIGLENQIISATNAHNAFLKELKLPSLPLAKQK